MAGTRTAPTVDGNATFKEVSLTFFDHTGEQRTDSYVVDSGATDIQIEAFAAAMQAMSNGTLWRVIVKDVYNSVGDSSNAVEDVWEDIDTNIVILAKQPAVKQGDNLFMPAPVNDAFIEGTEEINPAYVPLGDAMTAWLAMKSGYSVVSGRFTQRRDVGTKINF